MDKPLYLDYAASTPVDAEVAAAMCEVLGNAELAGNPSSDHVAGRRARTLVESSREQVAFLINAKPAEIIWTSGATESNNLAILGAARYRRSLGRHVVTSLTEHASVLEPFRRLESEGFQVSYVRPGRAGHVETTTVVSAFRADTTLVSVMHVNNETSVVQDIDALAEACRTRGILFHTDAAQSAAYLPIDVRAVEPALLSLSAHKMYGPKGIGALYVSEALGAGLEPVMFGGDQERGMRPGTVPTHQVVGFGKAAELARLRRAEDAIRIAGLRDELWASLSSMQDVWRNGAAGPCAPHILNVTFGGVEGESLLHELDDLIVSSGAACASGRGEPSPVLRVLGRSDALAQSSIRFSLGRQTTMGEIEIATAAIHRGIARLRAIAPGRRDSHELLAAH